MTIQAIDDHMIALELYNTQVTGNAQTLFCCYAPPAYEEEKDYFWSSLMALIHAKNGNWVFMVDLNEVMFQSEKKGDLLVIQWSNRLQEFMDESNAFDLGSSGLNFTWTNKKKGSNNIQQRFDRVQASQICISKLEIMPRFSRF